MNTINDKSFQIVGTSKSRLREMFFFIYVHIGRIKEPTRTFYQQSFILCPTDQREPLQIG